MVWELSLLWLVLSGSVFCKTAKNDASAVVWEPVVVIVRGKRKKSYKVDIRVVDNEGFLVMLPVCS